MPPSPVHSESPNTVSDTNQAVRDSLLRHLRQTNSLLLIRLRSLGDSILTLPLLDALHQWRPGLQIDILIEQPFSSVFVRNPAVREVLELKRGHTPGWTRLRAVRELRRRHYPAVLNLHGGSTSLLFSLATGARCRIGQEIFRRSWAYNFRIPASSAVWQKDRLHTVEHQLSLLRWLNLALPHRPAAKLQVDEGARQRVAERLCQARVAPRAYCVIHPTATLATKQWQEAKFAAVADYLSDNYGFSVILTSGPEEAQVLLDVGKHSSRRHYYWSDLQLGELFALIEGARLFIGNDSGPTHAAAALDRPIVVIWGSSDFHAWHPWNAKFEVVRSDLPCIPCPGYTCAAFGEPKCILDIPIERVLSACDRMLKRSWSVGISGSTP